ncbi:MAG: PAS domain-containing protein [Candidatus Moduliflexus flocculans]|nr:PAS domain-containing protein [Candidatus Moduliflexus flocculans]
MALYKHQMDESLKRQEQTIVALLNATTDALFIIDHAGAILALNETLAKRAGKRITDLVGTPFLELIPAGAISVLLAEKIREGLGGRSLRFEEEITGKWFDNNIYPIAESSRQRYDGRHLFQRHHHQKTDRGSDTRSQQEPQEGTREPAGHVLCD